MTASEKNKIRILHVIPNFFPATRWGGPIFSTKAICDGIADNPSVAVQVLTTDAAGPARNDNLNLPRRTVTVPEGYEITYYHRVMCNSVSPAMLLALPKAILWADVVHLTSTYSFPVLPTLLLSRLLKRPLVWSPRGAIQSSEEWDAAPRPRSKRAFDKLAQQIAPRKTVLHVTAEQEARATARRFSRTRIVTIPNSVDIPNESELPSHKWRSGGRCRLLFLSRVHEKKGIENLLEALKQLPTNFELDVYGDGESSYMAALTAQVHSLGLSKRVQFHGHVEGHGKSVAYRSADVFVLPSYSENFGIVVAEALAHGTPVITTDRTPWKELDIRGCGISIPIGVGPLVKAIEGLADLDLSAMGARGKAWMQRDFANTTTSNQMLALYTELAAARTKV